MDALTKLRRVLAEIDSLVPCRKEVSELKKKGQAKKQKQPQPLKAKKGKKKKKALIDDY